MSRSVVLRLSCGLALMSMGGWAATEPPEVEKQHQQQAGDPGDKRPDGKRNFPQSHPELTRPEAKPSARPRANGITYHGGPVMTGTPNAYVIWYGTDAAYQSTTKTVITDLLSNIGGSPYFNINTTYYNSASVHVSNAIHYAGSTSVTTYPYGMNLSDAQIQAVVSDAISSAALPKDVNGIYFVVTDKNVNASSGFCTQYCGWHTRATIGNADIKFSFIGSPDRCPSACSAVTAPGPNGNTEADAMASILSHELEETVTDPDLNAWYDNRGAENADKCAWQFGNLSTAANGSKYNMTLGSRLFLIQQNWVNANGGVCATHWP